MKKKRKIKIAVVGVGNMGANHVRVFKSLKNVSLTAICDTSVSRGKALSEATNTKFYTSVEELLEKEELDGASIVVPTHLHREVALPFIKRGINVFIEKPIENNVKDAKRIVLEAQKRNVVASVGHIERYNPVIVKLEEYLREGELGEIVSISAKRVGIAPPTYGGVDVVTDLAIHDIDVVLGLTKKEPNFVIARGGSERGRKTIDFANILLGFDNFSCLFEANWITPIKIRSLTVTGTKGYVQVDYLGQTFKFYKRRKLSYYSLVRSDYPSRGVKIKKQEPLFLELKNFIDSIIGKDKPKVSVSEALRSLVVAEKCVQSIKEEKLEYV